MTKEQAKTKKNDDDDSQLEFTEDRDQPLFAISSLNALHFASTGSDDPSRYQATQGLYISAAGMLTQFNAIMAAVLASAVPATTRALQGMVVAALLLHIAAAFALCWAARPVDAAPARSVQMALMATKQGANESFSSYRRGWKLTMWALLASAAAVVLFLAIEYGILPRYQWGGIKSS